MENTLSTSDLTRFPTSFGGFMVSSYVLAERNGATLMRVNGELRCRCPHACMAVSEPCEFKGWGE